jgi:hypothetical protein
MWCFITLGFLESWFLFVLLLFQNGTSQVPKWRVMDVFINSQDLMAKGKTHKLWFQQNCDTGEDIMRCLSYTKPMIGTGKCFQGTHQSKSLNDRGNIEVIMCSSYFVSFVPVLRIEPEAWYMPDK